jgi:hypothetical protein
MNQTHYSDRTSPGTLQWSIIALAVATAIIHIVLAFTESRVPFLLNGIGYLALVAALYLPLPQLDGRRGLVRFALIGYTALTVGLWFLRGEPTEIALLDKAIELALIGLVLLEQRRARAATARV